MNGGASALDAESLSAVGAAVSAPAFPTGGIEAGLSMWCTITESSPGSVSDPAGRMSPARGQPPKARVKLNADLLAEPIDIDRVFLWRKEYLPTEAMRSG